MKWYQDQRRLAFAIISTFVVFLILVIGYIGLGSELKAFTIWWPTCQFNTTQIMYGHYHGDVLFTNLEPNEAKVTMVNNGVCDVPAITVFERLSKGGVPVNNDHATYFTSATFRTAAKHTESVTLPAPSNNCLHDFVVVAGAAPPSLPINFAQFQVISSGMAGDKNHICS